MTTRALYTDPAAARAVLDAIGGKAERPNQVPIMAPATQGQPRAQYRGRCGNGEHPAQWIKVGDKRIKAEHCGRSACNHADNCGCRCAECLGAERAGCPNEIDAGSDDIRCACAYCRGITMLDQCATRGRFSPLRLCKECRSKYDALRPRDREHAAALDSREHMPGLCEAHGQRIGECGSCVR